MKAASFLRSRWLAFMTGMIAVVGTPGSAAPSSDPHPEFYVTNGAVTATAVLGNTLYIGGAFTKVGPSTSSFTRVDTATAIPALDLPKVDGPVNAMQPDGQGGWFLGGAFRSVGGLARANLAHVLLDRTVSDWNPGADGEVTTLALQDTTLYVGGAFTHVAGVLRNHLAAVGMLAGGVTGWNPDADQIVHAICVNDSTVYIGGEFSVVGGQSRAWLAEVDAVTGAATAWNPQAGDAVWTVLRVQSVVYAGGDFTVIGGKFRNRLASLSPTTGLATSWNPDLNGRPLTLLSDGETLYLGGTFSKVGSITRIGFAAFGQSTGGLTPLDIGLSSFGAVYSMALHESLLYVGGSFESVHGSARANLAVVDTLFGYPRPWAPTPNGAVHAIALSGPDVYAAGEFANFTSLWVARNSLAALDLTTGALRPWNPNPGGGVASILGHEGSVFVAGSFTTMGVAARSHLAELDTLTGAPTPWAPTPNGRVLTMAWSGATLYVGGNFTTVGGLPRMRLAAFLPPVSEPTAWNPGADAEVRSLVAKGRFLYVAGSFSAVGGLLRHGIAGLDSVTNTATSWDPAGPDHPLVTTLAVDKGLVYAGGMFTRIGGQPRNRLAALDRTSGLASPWNPDVTYPGGIAEVGVIVPTGPVVYIGGAFTAVGSRSRSSLAAVDAATGVATDWAPNPSQVQNDPFVSALTRTSSGLVVGGGFTSIDDRWQNNIAEVDSAAAPEPPFLVSVVSQEVTFEHVMLVWSVPSTPIDANIYRRAVGAGWELLGQRSTTSGTIAVDDSTVTPGTSYDYRLGIVVGGQEQFYGQVNVLVPFAPTVFPVPPTMALTGLRPNPAIGQLSIEFTLPDASPALLEVFDLTGRRFVAADVGGWGPGTHHYDAAMGRVRPGLYVVRLTRAGRSLTTRGVLLR